MFWKDLPTSLTAYMSLCTFFFPTVRCQTARQLAMKLGYTSLLFTTHFGNTAIDRELLSSVATRKIIL